MRSEMRCGTPYRPVGGLCAQGNDQPRRGAFGDNESIGRSSGAPVTNTPDESWGFNGRATWEPVFDTGKIAHLGVAGYYRTALKNAATRKMRFALAIVRISGSNNGNIADSG
jgi:phosphate-selective porin